MFSTLRVLPLLAVFLDWGLVHQRTPIRPREASAIQPRARAAGGDSLLLSPAQLRERLTRAGVVLLHIGERADYNASHIPGARFLPYEAVSTPHGDGLMLEIPPVAKLDSLLESLGISDASRIVLYWSRDWYSPTTRVFLTLDYLGLGDKTSILDGGFDAWRAAGGPTTKESEPATRGVLAVHPRSDVIVDAKTVRSAIGDSRVAVVDARDRRFYTGEAEGMHAREGHVPGARNLPFNTLLDERGAFKPRATLDSLLDVAGATPGKRVIGYCHIGQQASVVYFVARLLGREARLYDGSWDDWSRRADYPVETGRGVAR
jgi:thiosulfate/3-mercaptopyruvate sulfurtransferase